MKPWWKAVLGYIKTGQELITLAVFYFTIVGFQLGRPDVSVTYDLQDIAPAAGMSRTLATQAQNSAKGAAPSAIDSEVERLIKSPNILRVEIVNSTHARIDDFEITINGVETAADAALASSSPSMNENASNLALFKLSDATLSFPNLKTLPPRARITLLVWGKITPAIFAEPVRVSAAAPRIHISERRTISGFGLFIARNAGALTFVLLIYFLLTTMSRVRSGSIDAAEHA